MSFENLVPDHLLHGEAIVALAVLAAVLSIAAAWSSLLAGDPMAGRVKSLKARQEALRAGLVAPQPSRARTRLEPMGIMRRVTQKLNLLRSRQAEKITLQLAQAGWRSKDALVVFLFAKVSLPLAFAGGAMLFAYVSGAEQMAPAMKAMVAMVFVVIGAYLPEFVVKRAVARRQKAMQRSLPDALDLLVICAEAGLALDAALKRVAHEMERSAPEIADEFGLAAVELGFLSERRKALDNLAQRTDMASIRGVVNTLLQTEKYGTPLAQSLRVLASEYRGERLLKAEEKAAKLPATLTLPMIAFILPVLFIVLLGPAILKAIDGFSQVSIGG